jgi:hypothetical protein
MQKADDGDWVLYEDYARLKAEVERLTAEIKEADCDRLSAEFVKLSVKHSILKAEVERLTNAGDAMAEEMLKLNHPHASIYLWCRAKDGKGCKAEEGKQP